VCSVELRKVTEATIPSFLKLLGHTKSESRLLALSLLETLAERGELYPEDVTTR
jgi:hypothetical protein